jgi:site-specific DNA-methyltransferase (adenine-specific)
MTEVTPRPEIIHGDCIATMDRMERGSVDLIFADPPFNVGYGYDIYDDSRSADDYLEWSRDWISAARRLLTTTGCLWIAIGDEYAAELKVIAHRDVGLHLRSWVVWYYTFGVNCTAKFTRSHAHLLYFTNDRARHTFNADDPDVRVPSARQLVYNDRRANPKGRLPDDTWILRPKDIDGAFSPEQDTWQESRVCGTFKERVGWHPCQMPEKVLERVVRACSNPGDTVLDPFAGSGTTVAVAARLGRRSLGIELSGDYAARAAERCGALVRTEVQDEQHEDVQGLRQDEAVEPVLRPEE